MPRPLFDIGCSQLEEAPAAIAGSEFVRLFTAPEAAVAATHAVFFEVVDAWPERNGQVKSSSLVRSKSQIIVKVLPMSAPPLVLGPELQVGAGEVTCLDLSNWCAREHFEQVLCSLHAWDVAPGQLQLELKLDQALEQVAPRALAPSLHDLGIHDDGDEEDEVALDLLGQDGDEEAEAALVPAEP